MKRNVDRQEKVVSALWEFAADLQFRPEQGQVATIADLGGSNNAGTKCSLQHIGGALEKIMGAFGYTVTEIQ